MIKIRDISLPLHVRFIVCGVLVLENAMADKLLWQAEHNVTGGADVLDRARVLSTSLSGAELLTAANTQKSSNAAQKKYSPPA